MSKFDRLATFVLVFEEGSFAGCARKLNISSAAVSKQISLLEQELGFELLHRSTRTLKLTEAGTSYFDQARKVLHEMAEIDAMGLEMNTEPFGSLKVASARHYAESYILPHLGKFLNKYPKLQFSLELMERIPDLEREELDIVIGLSRSLSINSIQKTIGHTNYVLCASREYLNTHGTPKEPQDLKGHRYINHVLRVPVHIIQFKDGLEVYVEPCLLLNDTVAMKKCALDGLGIVKLHQYVVEQELKKGTLVAILQGYNEPKQPILVSYKQYKHLPSKIRCFLDFFTMSIGIRLGVKQIA